MSGSIDANPRQDLRAAVGPGIRDTRDAWRCALLVCAAAIATLPWAEVGLDDDWSFAHTALDAARSGHLLYYYWSEPIIGFQAYWAALFIRVFGFSFTLVRFTTLPLAMGSAALLFYLARYAGLARGPAFLAALSVMLSPLVIPLSSSFMTEVPALFFLLAVVYCGLRAVDDPEPPRSRRWLAAAAVLGYLGGTIRQPIWGLPLLMFPAIAYLRRDSRQLVLASAGMWLAVLAAAFATSLWFQAQPYTLDPTLRLEAKNLTEHFFRALAIVVLSVYLYVLPACLGLAQTIPGIWRRKWLFIIAPLIFTGLYFSHLDRAPWMGNLITHWGILDATTDIIGDKPRLFSIETEQELALATFAGFALSATLLIDRLGSRRWKDFGDGPAFRMAALALPFAVAYVSAVIARSGTEPYDRYLVPLMPVLSIALMLQLQNAGWNRVSSFAWIALAICAVYGICTTHDALAMRRAIAQAANTITGTGVPRHCISGGFEFDGWTQIEEGRFVGYQPEVPHQSPVLFWFWKSTPKVQPHFILTLSRQVGLEDSAFPPVAYTGWYPPGLRRIWTQVAPACDCSDLATKNGSK